MRLRLPHSSCMEVSQDGYRLVLLPKLAFYALWDGHGESFVVPRAAEGVTDVALPIGSYASAPVDNSDPQASGTGITGLPLPLILLLRRTCSFSLVVGSLASRGSKLTRVTPLMLHQLLPQVLSGCLVPLAPRAPSTTTSPGTCPSSRR